jgi:hypothetical protein
VRSSARRASIPSPKQSWLASTSDDGPGASS